MPKKRYIVTLTAEERSYLRGLISKGKTADLKQRHARTLLKTDQGQDGEHFTDEEVQHVLKRKEQKNRKAKKIDGESEAHLVALACSQSAGGTKAVDPQTAGRPTGRFRGRRQRQF